jgi:hypothetical protein
MMHTRKKQCQMLSTKIRICWDPSRPWMILLKLLFNEKDRHKPIPLKQPQCLIITGRNFEKWTRIVSSLDTRLCYDI